MPTPIEEQPHTVELHVEVNVYDAVDYEAAIASVAAAIERVDDIRLDDGTIVRWEAPLLGRLEPTTTYGQLIAIARDLTEHGASTAAYPDFTRGICNLLADAFPHELDTPDRMHEIEADINYSPEASA